MKYDDIIDLPHPVSEKYPRMTMSQRAAQFNPFAALTGYEEEVKEAARFTDEERYLTEDSVNALNEALTELKQRIGEKPEAVVCYFEPDERKKGGAYRCIKGKVSKIDELHGKLYLGQSIIDLNRILSIETEPDEMRPE